MNAWLTAFRWLGDIVNAPPLPSPLARANIKQTFYIRVAAIGDVAAQQVNPSGDPPDNTNWSGVIEVVPADQPPSSPGPVSLYVLDGSTLQVTNPRIYTI